MRRFLIIVVAVSIVVITGMIVERNLSSSSAPGSATPRVTLPAVPAVPIAPTTTTTATGRSGKAHPKSQAGSKDAVAAAVLAVANLSAAQLLPASKHSLLVDIVNQTVTPAKRAQTIEVLPYGGQLLARSWLYPNVRIAQQLAQYSIATQMYRVDSFDGRNAAISLFTVTDFVTYQDSISQKEHQVPNIVVVRMRKQNGRWYWVDTRTPPADQAPQPQTGLTYQETLAAFTPYLRGFKLYDSAS